MGESYDGLGGFVCPISLLCYSWISMLLFFVVAVDSADYNQSLRLQFKTQSDAIAFAEKQGWDYYIQQDTVKVRTDHSGRLLQILI